MGLLVWFFGATVGPFFIIGDKFQLGEVGSLKVSPPTTTANRKSPIGNNGDTRSSSPHCAEGSEKMMCIEAEIVEGVPHRKHIRLYREVDIEIGMPTDDPWGLSTPRAPKELSQKFKK